MVQKKKILTIYDKRKENDKPVANVQEELDRILDKISQVGYLKLSKKEKDFLKKYGDLIDNGKSGENLH